MVKRKPKPETKRPRTIGYIRCSTAKQVDKGLTLETQRAKIEAYAALYELDLVGVIEDAGESGGRFDRPGLQRALSMLSSGEAEALVIMKLDRLTRSVTHLGEIVERHQREGWALLSVSESIDTRTAAGRMVCNVLMSVAQWQREDAAERTSVALQHKLGRGEYIGGRTVPYGQRIGADGVKLEDEPDEQRHIKRLRKMRTGGLSYRSIATKLNAEGVAYRGGKWHPTSIVRILDRA